MNRLFLQLSLMPIALAAAITTLPSQAAETLEKTKAIECKKTLRPGSKHLFACPLPTFTSAQQAHVKVELSGGHDDSLATLALQHNGKTLSCAQGNKTESEGEDGDIVLECRFTLPADVLTAPSNLAVTLVAHHTELEHYSLTLD